MPSDKRFTLYTHKLGPNGWKVSMLLEELGLSNETDVKFLEFDKKEHKQAPHIELNPNGRIPTLVDHGNDDFAVWESDAILLYLVEKYDKDGKFALPDANDKFLQLQWLFFQASGQGPYFGQGNHFLFSHPAVLPTAVKRYQDEAQRVINVLESVLSKQEWLVGGKFGITDIALFPWHDIALKVLFSPGSYNPEKEAPHVHAWYKRVSERPAIKKVWDE
ncbi:glutathione S-transferase, partial [Gloeophyllum trabeum ATCC 11539]